MTYIYALFLVAIAIKGLNGSNDFNSNSSYGENTGFAEQNQNLKHTSEEVSMRPNGNRQDPLKDCILVVDEARKQLKDLCKGTCLQDVSSLQAEETILGLALTRACNKLPCNDIVRQVAAERRLEFFEEKSSKAVCTKSDS